MDPESLDSYYCLRSQAWIFQILKISIEGGYGSEATASFREADFTAKWTGP